MPHAGIGPAGARVPAKLSGPAGATRSPDDAATAVARLPGPGLGAAGLLATLVLALVASGRRAGGWRRGSRANSATSRSRWRASSTGRCSSAGATSATWPRNDTIRDPAADLSHKRRVLRRAQETYPDYAVVGLISPEGRVLATSTGVLSKGSTCPTADYVVRGREGPVAIDVHDAQLLATLQPTATCPTRRGCSTSRRRCTPRTAGWRASSWPSPTGLGPGRGIRLPARDHPRPARHRRDGAGSRRHRAARPPDLRGTVAGAIPSARGQPRRAGAAPNAGPTATPTSSACTDPRLPRLSGPGLVGAGAPGRAGGLRAGHHPAPADPAVGRRGRGGVRPDRLVRRRPPRPAPAPPRGGGGRPRPGRRRRPPETAVRRRRRSVGRWPPPPTASAGRPRNAGRPTSASSSSSTS